MLPPDVKMVVKIYYSLISSKIEKALKMLMNFCRICSVFGQFMSFVHFSLFFHNPLDWSELFVCYIYYSLVLCVHQKNFSLNLSLIFEPDNGDFHYKCVLVLGWAKVRIFSYRFWIFVSFCFKIFKILRLYKDMHFT